MRILITGTTGFVGHKLKASYKDAIAAPSLRNATQDMIKKIVEESEADVVIHTAAISDIGTCQKDPQSSYFANVQIPLYLAAACKDRKLICFSSDQVYRGCAGEGPYKEEDASPCNVYGRHKLEMEEQEQIAREKELIIFSDEIYDRLVMDGYEHTSIASLAPDVFCVTFSGLSKSHMIAGFRIGWMILSGAKDKAKGYIEGIKMLSSMRLCSNVPAQSIVQTALGGYQSVTEYIKPGGRVYEQRDFIYKALNDIPGITAVKPKAAFYIFPKIDTEKFNIHNDEQFALDFLHEKQVLLVPGKGFNWNCPDHFRVVYLPNVRQLEKAMDKLKDFLSTYKQR